MDDSSIEKSEKIIKLFQKYYRRIKYTKSEINRGEEHSKSLEINYVIGKYIAHFDYDDF